MMAAIASRHLPATDDTRGDHWTTRARCKDINPDLAERIFFPTRANCGDAYLAKRFCDACPVAPQCLAEALERPRNCGVWAGHYFDQGSHKEIIPPRLPPQDRHESARIRRRAAYEHYGLLVNEGLSPATARRMIAAREKVDESTVRVWIRRTRAENKHGGNESP